MTNPFAHHGIDHLSASSINLFCAEPAMWVQQYLFKFKSRTGAAMARGSASEVGIEMGLFRPEIPVADCIDHALADYDRRMVLSPDHNKEKERDGIAGIVEVGLAELRQYGVPVPPEDGRQHKISVAVEGLPVPIIGFLDFDWSQHGIIVDLKTQLRLTSSISAGHARQGAIYTKARGGNIEMRFAYCTPKKIGVYPLQDARGVWNEVENVCHRIQRFLAISNDKAELAGIIAPDYDAFYWNEPAARSVGRDIYGF